MARTSDTLARQSQLVLWAGFGSLLLLMAFAGFGTVQESRQIQSRTEGVQNEFLQRDNLLHEIRSNLYLSGTYVRDYLLDPDPPNAPVHLRNLNRVREEMDAALAQYSTMVEPAGSAAFLQLNRSLVEYWRVLDPIFKWTPEVRRDLGPAFVADQLLPRRRQMLSVADQIADVNERQLNLRNQRVGELYTSLRRRTYVTLALLLGIGGLLAAFSIRRILALEREATQRFEEARELSARLVRVQEDERRTISRELHDEVGQLLSALLVGVANVSSAVPAELGDELIGIRKLAENCVAAVRNMALLLRPSMLDDLGLVPALEWQARETSRRTGLQVRVEAHDVPDELPEEFKTCVYRVVQEALHNVTQHARAKSAAVTVSVSDHQLNCSVTDDGHGFDAARTRGLGILGMQERVTNLGGSLQVRTEPGRGACIDVTLPLGGS